VLAVSSYYCPVNLRVSPSCYVATPPPSSSVFMPLPCVCDETTQFRAREYTTYRSCAGKAYRSLHRQKSPGGSHQQFNRGVPLYVCYDVCIHIVKAS
jgi:hypothetical protein